MKKLILLLLFTYPLLLPAQQDSLGFTNKAEAKKLTAKGVKEGKWIEYFNQDNPNYKDTNAPSYRLTIYKTGKPYGIVHYYYNNGALLSETPYKDGIINGILTLYYKNGKIKRKTPFVNGVINGIEKEYYENGKLKKETTYNNDVAGTIKDYDKNGNEIK
jgi:antitoxin component YwqK of YwqJK toxin-antitoxin module